MTEPRIFDHEGGTGISASPMLAKKVAISITEEQARELLGLVSRVAELERQVKELSNEKS
jgi:hypothetical protein